MVNLKKISNFRFQISKCHIYTSSNLKLEIVYLTLLQFKRTSFLFFSFSFFVFLGPLSMLAQGYGMAAGLRVGNGVGITYQQQVALNTSIEGILQRETSTNDATLNVLYEAHRNLLTQGLNVYAGGGLYYTWLTNRANLIVQPSNILGVSPIVGAELTIANFNVSIDFKPMIKVSGGEGLSGFEMQSAFSLRYVLAGRYYKNDKWKFWKNWFKKK
jgi:hypothetical protein